MPDAFSRVYFEPMRSINSASFTGSYQAIGSTLSYPSRYMLIVNNSGVIVTISFDGTNDHIALVPGAAWSFDENTNSEPEALYNIAKGTQVYAKGTADTGLVYLSTAYAL